MLGQIKVLLQRLPHPYDDDPDAPFQCWGSLVITVDTDGGLRRLCDIQWDVLEFAEWIVEHATAICSERLSLNDDDLNSLPGESLAQTLARLQQRDFESTDEESEFQWFTRLFEFRQRHVLTFAMRGSRIPPITIGCHRGAGEISLVDGDVNWAYQFDMDEFLDDLYNCLRGFLDECDAQGKEEARKRALLIKSRLNKPPQSCCASTDSQ